MFVPMLALFAAPAVALSVTDGRPGDPQ